MNQWIKKPRGLGPLGTQIVDNSAPKDDDPVSLFAKLGKKDLLIFQDYMNLWTRSLSELL